MADEGWMEFISVVAPIALKAIGSAAAAGDFEEADRLRQQAAAQYNIPLPDLQTMMKAMGPTNLAGVSADPRYAGAADDALAGFKGMSETGFSDQDRAGYAQAGREAGNVYSGMMGRNAQLRAARGQTGGGADTADQMAAASLGADRANRSGLEVASRGADRRYQALGAYGSMAERLKGADLSQKNLTATAQDRIDEFNTKAARYAPQQQFENQALLAAGKTGGLNAYANAKTASGNKTENTYADVGEGISRGASAYDEARRYDEYLKKKYG